MSSSATAGLVQSARKTRAPREDVRPLGVIRSLAAALASLSLLLLAGPPAAADPIPFPREEDFAYDIRFLGFLRVAEGRLRIRRVSGRRYRAELLAETKGLIGFLTAYQRNRYVSEMEYVPEEGRLMPRRFIKVVTWASGVMKSVTELDYEKGESRWVATEDGEVKDKGTEPIPEGVVYEDMLSAFFNLRRGAFGPLTRGRRLTTTSLPFYQATEEGRAEYEKEFLRTFEIRIADARTERAYRHRFDRTDEKGLLVIVQVPGDLFGQRSGEVIVWFDRNLIPVAARVEDVVFFGDVSGVLRRAPVGSTTGIGRPMPKGVKGCLHCE